MKLPTLISEPAGVDTDGTEWYGVQLFPVDDTPCKTTQVMADNHFDALYFAACEWRISDYAYKTRGPNHD